MGPPILYYMIFQCILRVFQNIYKKYIVFVKYISSYEAFKLQYRRGISIIQDVSSAWRLHRRIYISCVCVRARE